MSLFRVGRRPPCFCWWEDCSLDVASAAEEGRLEVQPAVDPLDDLEEQLHSFEPFELHGDPGPTPY